MKRLIHITVLTYLFVGQFSSKPPAPVGPVASERQLKWHELEYYAFIHFNMNTFTDKEGGDGTESPELFDPTSLNCRQWAKICKEAGMKAIIITAKHGDGFCLWPSKYTDHSVRNSSWRNGKGDVLKELSEACREYGLQTGVYLSPTDRHVEVTSKYGPEYKENYKNQIEELLTSYGDIFEFWVDATCPAWREGDYPAFYEIIRKLQPNAVIFSDAGPDVRWVGNESGYAGETNWCPLRRDEIFHAYDKPEELTAGHENGTYWVPAECDVSIRPGWFYHPSQDDKVKSVQTLVDVYFRSVGRNANLLLNVPVDRRGFIHERDSTALMGLKKVLDETFDYNLVAGASATASQVRGNDSHFDAMKVIDGDKDSYWATDDSVKEGSLIVELKKPTEFNCIMLQEYIPLGQRVEAFSVEAWDGKEWKKVAAGTTIGYKRLMRIPSVEASRVRLRILRSRACPTISNFALYRAPEI